MFIRRTQTRTTTTGETYFTHRLVRSERVGDKVRQRTLLNLGRHFDAAQNDWPALCRRIEARKSSAANCNWRPIARRRSNRTPNTSPPSCSPGTGIEWDFCRFCYITH